LYGPAGEATTNIVVAPSHFVSSNTVTFEHMALNLTRANQLLDAAGWLRGTDGTRAKDGVPMAILFQTTINPLRQKTQDIIKAGWEQLGVRVELKAVPAAVYFSSDPASPDNVGHFYADVQMLTSGSLLPDWVGELAQFTTAELSQRANEWRGSNNARYSSPEYDRLWRNLKGETNPNQRSALTVQLNDHLIREAVIVPLVARRTPVSAKAKRLQGIIPNPWDSELWNIADWTMTP
jgi:peptide/nickel transport system substrate-binding protein